MTDFYQDPKKALAFLFDPNTPLSDTDTAAAEYAVGGGMAGSQFAGNSRLRLRDAERINRLQIGENLLQPYLNRSSAEGIAAGNNAVQREQIAAQAASDAIRESGAMTRLNAEQAGALQRALIGGNQQAAHDLLTEAGADRRQAATLSAQLQERTMANQTNILQSLLGYAGAQGRGGAGGGGSAAAPGMQGNPIFQGGQLYTGPTPTGPVRSTASGTGLSGKLGSTLDAILRQYNLA